MAKFMIERILETLAYELENTSKGELLNLVKLQYIEEHNDYEKLKYSTTQPVEDLKWANEKIVQLQSRIVVEANGLACDEMIACREGRKIDAIQLVRMRRDIGLKDAKDLVESYKF